MLRVLVQYNVIYFVPQIVPTSAVMELFQGDSYIPLIRSRTHFLSDSTRCFGLSFFHCHQPQNQPFFPPRSLAPFVGEQCVKTMMWVLGVLVAARVSLLQGSLRRFYTHTCTHTYACTHTYIYLLLKIYGKFQAYTKVQILTITQLEQQLISGQSWFYLYGPSSFVIVFLVYFYLKMFISVH